MGTKLKHIKLDNKWASFNFKYTKGCTGGIQEQVYYGTWYDIFFTLLNIRSNTIIKIRSSFDEHWG